MILLNPDNTTHTIKVILRDSGIPGIIRIYNDITGMESRLANGVKFTSTITNGVTSIVFDSVDLPTSNGDSFHFLIEDNTGTSRIVFRGLMYVTNQTPQDFRLTEGKYFY